MEGWEAPHTIPGFCWMSYKYKVTHMFHSDATCTAITTDINWKASQIKNFLFIECLWIVFSLCSASPYNGKQGPMKEHPPQKNNDTAVKRPTLSTIECVAAYALSSSPCVALTYYWTVNPVAMRCAGLNPQFLYDKC